MQVILPELALVHFSVCDQSDNKREIAYVALPVDSIRPGFRYINLLVCHTVMPAIATNTPGRGADR